VKRQPGKSIALIYSVVIAANAFSADWEMPRTDAGDPDLQGIWTNATITSLERPQRYKDLVLTEDEASRWERQNADLFESIDDVPDGELQAGQDVGGYNTFWMDPGTRVMRVGGEIRSSIVTSPENGRLPFRIGARIKLYRFLVGVIGVVGGRDGPEQRALGERCIVGFGSTGGPPMLPVLYNNNYQIVQSPGHIMILVEMNHDARIIRMNSEHLPSNVRPWLGDSIGRWEGDTLVVETTNFNPGQSFRAAIKHQFFLTREAVVTERFMRVSPSEINYQFTVDDPGGYTESWRGEIALRKTDGPIYEYACHEGNYALPGILRGARLEEKLASQGSE
jgi:hypothetical protein|tara:strand:+ start:4145 stop:5152 length:1008 start_codon:yes stop_codon:yes gene_type:complete